MPIIILLLAILLFATSGATYAQTCNGYVASIVGTEGDDDIDGTEGDDVIAALGGNDRVKGFGGNDIICGGDGDDDLLGDAGDDQIWGGGGNDVLDGGDDTDNCDGVVGVDSASADCENRVNVDTRVLPVSLTAADGTQLDGALYVPVGDALQSGHKYRKTAIILSHGAMGSFDSSIPRTLSLQAAPLGFTALALNRRDSGAAGGGGAVLFEDATRDIGVGIDLLDSMGYRSIYIGGHSQGTQNAGIYPSFTLDPRVSAVGMYGAVDDGRTTASELLFPLCGFVPEICYDENVIKSEQLILAGQGDDVIGWPTIFGQDLFRSPRNFLSYWGPDSLSVLEREIKKLEVPALLMRADGDEFTPDQMSQNVLAEGLDAGVDITYTILDYPFPPGFLGGNAHGFVGVERETIAETFSWLSDRVPEVNQFTRSIKVPRVDQNGNFVPLANAGDDLTANAGGELVTLDGSRSVDIDGRVDMYRWFQIWGPRVTLNDSSSAFPAFSTGAGAQQLYFILVVFDDAGAAGWDIVSIRIAGSNCVPPASGASWNDWLDYWKCKYKG